MTMTLERFGYLVDAYGGDLRRWPTGERAAAGALATADPAAADLLQQARKLDAMLDAAASPVPAAAFRERVIAGAAVAGLRPRRRGGLGPLAWLSGAGWAASACAGVASGVMLAQHVTAELTADTVLYQASLHGPDDTEVLGG